MKNKFILVFSAFLLSILSTFSQDMSSLKIDTEKIYKFTTTLDYDAILDLTYPKVFELVPKAQMKEMLVSTFKGNEEMKINLLNVEPDFKYGEFKKIGNQTFCLIEHNLAMDLIINKVIEDDELEMMTDLFKSGMETEDVTYNKEKKSFRITKKSTMIGIFDKYTNNKWCFLNRDKKNILANKLFSKKVIKELGL